MISLKIVKGAEIAVGVVPEMRLPEPLTGFVIGRDPAVHWPIPDPTRALSARHCEVLATPAGVVLRDLSTNGTFVNGAMARPAGDHVLNDGDRFELGPYTILVQGTLPAAASRPAAAAPTPAASPPTRPPSVQATAPSRGGDPAAMLASAAPPREGLTEILRAAPPAEDSPLEVTKIRLAPKTNDAAPARPAGRTPMPAVGAAAAASLPVPVPVPVQEPAPVPAPPAAASAAGVEPLLAALAAGLGLPPEALAGRDAAQAVAQAGALARAAVEVLRQLLEQQAQGRRQIGSRAPALQAVRDVNPLRLAATPEAALLALLAPGARPEVPLRRAAAELTAHEQRMLAAFRHAAQQLGEEIAPEALEAALPTSSGSDAAARLQARQARLWTLYTQVWQGMGLAPGLAWSQGFVEAAQLHLATAYDKPGPAAKT
ncbi:MAG: type VI secretion system-associated FHA domain protein TagH [Leptothrix sp. (in: Bacteria)]|nr:type VI secretion system-associated FHA domain protein TagH [Leptothrix sp. (in: b-proteobacteria)]